VEGGLRITSSSRREKSPLITVITAVFNGSQFLERTILSVLAYKKKLELEYLVIDGGSTDGTLEILKKYDDAVDYWTSAPDKGIYDAFNKGWNLSSDDSFVLFLGAGDILLTLPDATLISGSQVVYGHVMFDEGRRFTSKVDFRLRLGNTIHHQAMLVKKSLCPVSPFDLKFRTYADFDFNQRLLKQGVKFTFADHFASYALPGGESKDFRMRESLEIVRKNFGILYAGIAFLYYVMQQVRDSIVNRKT
jgi:glycosyltransferase involved in cell wall biosynthesis